MLPVIPIVAAATIGGLAYYWLKPKTVISPPSQLPPKASPTLFTKADLVKAKIVPPTGVAVDVGPAVKEYTQDEIWAGSLTQKTTSESADDALTGAALGAMGIVNTQKDPLALRSAASTASGVLKWMAKGSPLTIWETTADGKWVKVQQGSVTGWAYKEFVKQTV